MKDLLIRSLALASRFPHPAGQSGFRASGTLLAGVAAALLLALPTPTLAQEGGEAPGDTLFHVLEPVVVEGRMDDLTGIATTASEGITGYRDFRLRPLVREGELLETVPGFIMTQHSGDGKSNQMFVRGFNLDHGTDFSTRVEGMQVNFPTHAHGQGYTDLNFIIPELVDHVEYNLGNYYAEIGDFGSAGGAHLRLRRSLPTPLVSTSLGEDGFQRIVAAASGDAGPGHLLAGAEIKRYDGPWAIPQDLQKLAGMVRYSIERGDHLFSILALGYDNAWDASDQIPSRVVQDGTIGRFGQVDSTLGGASSRASVSATWSRDGRDSSQRLDLYGIAYDLDLYSNFTYFLDDPVAGDQIQQEDAGRTVLGANLAHIQPAGRHTLTLGMQTRVDLLDVALRRTSEREVGSTVRSDDATQWGTGAYAEVVSRWTPRFRTVVGLRGDYYRFDVTSDLPTNSGEASDGIASPKASLIFQPTERMELYLSGGLGFHSNDARGTVQSIDPGSGEPVDSVDPLVRSNGGEIGVRATLLDRWRSTLTGWVIDLDSELLFVGDAGTTEPSDATRRFGATWTNAFRLTPELRGDFDVSLARARFTDLPDGEDRVPGALENVVTAGLSWEPANSGPFAAARLRHFGEYPLVEDASERAQAASLVNLSAGWTIGSVRIGANVINVFDAQEADIQYFYGSRLPGEPAEGVEDLHYHPVEPRQVRVTLSWGL